jgi:hypothetical protein
MTCVPVGVATTGAAGSSRDATPSSLARLSSRLAAPLLLPSCMPLRGAPLPPAAALAPPLLLLLLGAPKPPPLPMPSDGPACGVCACVCVCVCVCVASVVCVAMPIDGECRSETRMRSC